MTRETTITQFPSAKPTSPDQISKQLSPAAGNPGSTNPGSSNPGSTNPGSSNPGSTALVASPERELEHLDRKQLEELQSALDGAQAGNWRDLKTVFELTGIFPPKDNASPTDA